jgi:site-specific DNA-cytosine methylase
MNRKNVPLVDMEPEIVHLRQTQLSIAFGNGVGSAIAPGGQAPRHGLRTLDLFAGAGGITEGFQQAGFECLYGNDSMDGAIRTFAHNHPGAWADPRSIEDIDPAKVRKKLGVAKGELDVLVGGPPCQGFSINAPERFLNDSRNSLFKHYARFLGEFLPRTFLFENVPGLLSLGVAADSARVRNLGLQRNGAHHVCAALWRATGTLAAYFARFGLWRRAAS